MNTVEFKNEEKEIPINAKSKVIGKETAYHCKICDKYYASYKSYGNHTRSYHGKNKEKSKCPYCGNSFTRRDNLQQHIKLFHTSIDKQFVCTFCGELFVSRSSCMKHKEKCVKTMEYNEQHEHNIYVTKKIIQPITNSNETGKIKNHLANPDNKKSENNVMVNGYNGNYQQKLDNGVNCDCGDCEMYTTHKNVQIKKGTHNALQNNNASHHVFVNNIVNNNYVSKPSEFYPERRVLQYTQRNQYIDNKVEPSLQYSTLKDSLVVRNENEHVSECYLVNKDEQQYPVSNEINDFGYDQENRHVSKEIYDGDSYYGENIFESNDQVSEALDCTNCNITFLTRHDYDNHKPFCEGKDCAV